MTCSTCVFLGLNVSAFGSMRNLSLFCWSLSKDERMKHLTRVLCTLNRPVSKSFGWVKDGGNTLPHILSSWSGEILELAKWFQKTSLLSVSFGIFFQICDQSVTSQVYPGLSPQMKVSVTRNIFLGGGWEKSSTDQCLRDWLLKLIWNVNVAVEGDASGYTMGSVLRWWHQTFWCVRLSLSGMLCQITT
jgi:hypothetical protein